MLVALSLIVIGNGFFKPNISTIVGSLYDKGDRTARCRFHDFLLGHQCRAWLDRLGPGALSILRRLGSAGGPAFTLIVVVGAC